MAKILVTGGAGFIGHALVNRLLEQGFDVTVADLKPSRHSGVRQVVGDLLDPQILETSLTPGTDAVIHLAAFTSVLKSLAIPYQVYETNLKMTMDLLERSREVGVRQFVLASSNAVVGNVGSLAIHEEMILKPLTPYGATKAAAEMLLTTYQHAYGVSGASLRMTNVYGTGMMNKDSMIPRLMRAALAQAPVHIYGDGEQVRDYIFLDDVVETFLTVVTRGLSGPLTVGFGRSVSVNTLVNMAREATGIPIPVDYVEPKPGEMPAVVVETSRLRSLGLIPQVDLPEGLKRVWEDFKHFD
ncbi:MAG: NAD-dependent epimerase/dehydratase family protein [Firmicutes bacterium]|jgi:UDP-glucose 4-epimerase|uniref:UDP-glucose 4-epimerase n=1 Tax=Sulfobacillus benefaciens TaxID=453960 RepID=A0A2T2X114_9FIRM|nr:NAD-dependent epimerase/dehydratase family protein [Bacillota bacterium]PSR28166.1 MAG: UDP-glucose 4-epimerase [Sulfobacillus benefaciens]